MKKYVLCFALLFTFICSSLYTENISDKIQFNGFLSQGFVYSSHNDFIANSSRKGSFEMNEFGLTFSADITSKLRLGFQLLARDFGTIGNHQIKLDWGFADYRFSNAFGIRFGKIKSPIALFNEIRDTDALHPMAILPQSIYDETMRPVFIAYDGLGVYGKLKTNAIGDFSYHLFFGTVNHPSDAPYVKQVYTATNIGLSEVGISIEPIEMNSELLHGGRLLWKPFRGVRLGGGYMYNSSIYKTTLHTPIGDAPTEGRVNISKCFFLSAEFNLGNFSLTSEYMEQPINIYLDLLGEEQSLSGEVMQGFYVLGSFIIDDKVTISAFYDIFHADKNAKDGANAVRMGYPDYFGWQKDLAFGLRYDINFNWTLKLDWHFIDGLAKSYVFAAIADTKKKWNMLVAKVSFNF